MLMQNAKRDENNVPTLLATSEVDGTPVRIKANPITHALEAQDATSGSSLGGDTAARDDNYIPVLMGVSSVDGVTPVAVYADPVTGKLLIDSN